MKAPCYFRFSLTLAQASAVIFIFLFETVALAAQFKPGEPWLDTSGEPIQAHSGGMLIRDKTYYWYGEDRSTRRTAVSCYSSTNLYAWKHEGTSFSTESLPPELRTNSFIERPKVIFNAHSGKYVLWFHLEQRGYHFARAGIAIGNKPAGPFVFFQAIRPISNDFEFKEDDIDGQKQFGGTFRDMNLFVDDDGKAYVFYASEGNWTMYVVRLNDDFTGPVMPAVQDRTWARILVRKMREAPAPFKFKNRYYLITSGCTGWKPNRADYAVADHILGPWESKGNPCTGPDAELTYGAQSTFVLPAPNRSGAFIFMADRWVPSRLGDSRYLWLPLTLDDRGHCKVTWQDNWDLSLFDKP